MVHYIVANSIVAMYRYRLKMQKLVVAESPQMFGMWSQPQMFAIFCREQDILKCWSQSINSANMEVLVFEPPELGLNSSRCQEEFSS